MFETHTFGFAIARPVRDVYEFLLEPRNFEQWAFTGGAPMRHLRGRDWAVETTVGPRIIRFATRNAFGVLDHEIKLDANAPPQPTGMRVVANGGGTELIYTFFRRDGLSDVQWASTRDWVTSDLLALQGLLEVRGKTGPLLPARSLSLSIDRPVGEVYTFLAEPLNFGRWAFAGDAQMRALPNGEWTAETSIGPRILRFAELNSLGVLDYSSQLPEGDEPLPVPMWVRANGIGTELLYVFFRRPGTTDEIWASTREWVTADLNALKSLLETRRG